MQLLEAAAPAFFFSDVHLGAGAPDAERSKERRLLRFLEAVGASGRSLFCLGDLFDFWFEYETAIPRRHFRVLRALQELSERGVGLYFLGGNHDWWVRRGRRPGFLERDIGFRLLEDGAEVRAGGLRLLLLHGDGVAGSDRGYRLLKRVLRDPVAIGLFRWVHPDLARALGDLTSRTSRRAQGGAPRAETCQRIREHASALLASRTDLDAVLAGHAHLPEDTPVAGGRYVNLGDWISHATYALVDGGRLTLRSFDSDPRPAADPILLAAAPRAKPR
ncbi:MAG: UDP-2,3-diacylglucosamine diphosphatase [Gemmatimonadota bacterium]